MAYEFDVGDVVKAGTEFAGTVVEFRGNMVVVESRSGDLPEFHPNDLKETC